MILAGWAAALAAGSDAYAGYVGLLGSPIGKLVLLGETFAVFFNIAYTIRQTFWDTGKGFQPRVADMTGAMAIAFAVVATIVTWVIAHANGAF